MNSLNLKEENCSIKIDDNSDDIIMRALQTNKPWSSISTSEDLHFDALDTDEIFQSILHEDQFLNSSTSVDLTDNASVIDYEVDHYRFRLIKDGDERGVYSGNLFDPQQTKLSSPIEIVATTCDMNREWGRILEWHDAQNIKHSWVMPMKLLSGDGLEMRRELMSQGAVIESSRYARENFLTYLLKIVPNKHATVIDQTGWFRDLYVLPDQVFGQQTDDMIIYQSKSSLEPPFSQSGTLEEWQQQIAIPSISNSRLVFSISLAFAGALLEPLAEESGGFHYRGGSSIGKSTALELASSVFGKPSMYKKQWRATSNGLETVAVLYNDGLLVLDEISQCEPREIGKTIYMLANQQGKTRADSCGNAKKSASWRLMILSSGEESLASILNKVGEKSKAGQENRLADIPADAGQSLGIFDCLNGESSANEFANKLKKASQRYYGVVGIEWLAHIANDRATLTEQAQNMIEQFIDLYVPKKSDGLIYRVAKRFAIVAAAGECATRAGLTAWDIGEATKAAVRCFNDWIANVGGLGNFEEKAILKQIRSFIEANESSRFEKIVLDPERYPSNSDVRVHKRVGYVKHITNKPKEYIFFKEQFESEICKSLDLKHVLNVLKKYGWLNCNSEKDFTKTVRLPNQGSQRMYVLNDSLWDWDDGSTSPVENKSITHEINDDLDHPIFNKYDAHKSKVLGRPRPVLKV